MEKESKDVIGVKDIKLTVRQTKRKEGDNGFSIKGTV